MSSDGGLKRKILTIFTSSSGLDPKTFSIKELQEGFTNTSKFIVIPKKAEKSQGFFLKVADEKTHVVDAFLIEVEAKIYSMLKKWELTETIFPAYKGLIINEGLRILVLDYLSNVSWGGPWNENTIGYLYEALDKLHFTKLSQKDKDDLTALAEEIRSHLGQKSKKDSSGKAKEEKIRAFLDTWDSETSGFKNNKGVIYFRASRNLPRDILEVAERKDPNPPEQLIMHDLNYANIGFSHKQAYFVDPVFARVGDPIFDRVVAGINILQQLGGLVDPKLKRIVIDKFIKNKPILALLAAYYVTIAGKDFKETKKPQLKWQKFHQECAVAALNVFVEWTK